jgi:GNAT superfamily N-acetyltransferase
MSLEPGGAYRGAVISYQWRGEFASAEVEALHAAGFGRAPAGHDWRARVERHSLGWVCARHSAGLAGFVNVAWDGGGHAFLLDTVVAGPLRRQGVGTRLVQVAAGEASAAGCEWLHVDFEDHLGPFYFGVCGFQPTNAGLIRLTAPRRSSVKANRSGQSAR